MGVKHLWTVLTPFCERKPLYELQGKTVAVDLSCWICEAQNIAEYQVQPRMYLRNLYFRTCYLLLMDVTPVFVLEGKAPELKYDKIAARNAIQFKGAKPKSDKVKTGKDRTRFHFVLRQCEEMLGYLGLACVKGNGEAESLCAYLNEDGLVDGCISQDSDCFAYGAQVVYRNFSISTQGAHSASGGAVDIYDIKKAQKSINFGRNKIVAMALLLGCDYNDGVQGVGKESMLKLFEIVNDDEILDRLRSWRTKTDFYAEYEKQLSDKNICTSCGHTGKLQGHTKNGCIPCHTTKGCDPLKFKEKRLTIKNEVNMRSKALQDTNFPDENLVNEFLIKKDYVSKLNVKWKQPDLVQFVKFTVKFLQWEELYAFEKILPILTRWQCLNSDTLKKQTNLKGIVHPEKIKKIRNPKGVPSYEIIWKDEQGCFKGLVPESQLQESSTDPEKLWSTIEPQHLVEQAYPRLVEEFRLSKIKPKKPSKRKKKDGVDCIDKMLQNTSISEPKPKKTRKPRTTKQKASKTNTIDELNDSFDSLKVSETNTLDNFLKKALTNAQKQKNDAVETEDGAETIDLNDKNCYSSTPTKTKPNDMDYSIDFDLSKFGDEDDVCDLSNIVDEIVARQPLALDHNLKTEYLKDFVVTKVNSESVNNLKLVENFELNSSSFFTTNLVENDLFEKTFDQNKYDLDDSDKSHASGDDTIEYDFNEKGLTDREGDVEKNCVEDEDSFYVTSVPLLERLKQKY